MKVKEESEKVDLKLNTQKTKIMASGPIKVKFESELVLSCSTLRSPMDCSPPGSSIHVILQARILEWVSFSFTRGYSWPRERTQVSHIAGRHFNLWATREDHGIWSHYLMTNRWGNSWNSHRLYFWGVPQSLQMVTAAIKLKDACSLEEKLWPTETAY